ncbi:MAG: NAD(P)/FAD-dependent oxidoreductase [Candidatus Eremiobacteraeota bacterium]|nr:NAD(P)/FAD-dependent oxidoreductase [Candidatus Eremiobacteraeota bacterium]
MKTAVKEIVIIGGGFAGLAAAREFERRSDRRSIRLTLINRENYMLFTPMLPEVAGGALDARTIAQPLRAGLRACQFELADVIGVDHTGRTLSLRHPLTHQIKSLTYDELVLALGSTSSTMGVPGVEKFTLALKSIADAVQIRNRVLGALEVAARTSDLVERDRLLRFAIVGGGFTGVEAAGELRGFLHAILHYYPAIKFSEIEVVIIESGQRLLAHLPEKFGKSAAASLSDRGVRIKLGDDVAAVDGHGLELKSGANLPSRTIIWSTGIEPSPLVKSLGLPVSKHGAVKVNGDFSVEGVAHLWAIGDCAAVPKAGGGTYAPLAQNATREGPLVARNILASLKGRPTRNFRYKELGQMASLGDRQAVAELPGGGLVSGTAAWLLWRSYYLGRLPGWSRKARVAMDWTLEIAFPRGSGRLPLIAQSDTSFEEMHALNG